MPEPAPVHHLPRGPIRGWRYLVVAALLLAAGSLFVSVLLWARADQAISGNRAIACGLARLGGSAPAKRQPGMKPRDFRRSLHAFKELLRDANTAGCVLPKPVKGSVTAKGHQAKHSSSREVVVHGAGSSPGGLPGPGSSSPGAGSQGGGAGGQAPGSSGNVGGTTTPPSSSPPGALDPAGPALTPVAPSCHLNALGVQVCNYGTRPGRNSRR